MKRFFKAEKPRQVAWSKRKCLYLIQINKIIYIKLWTEWPRIVGSRVDLCNKQAITLFVIKLCLSFLPILTPSPFEKWTIPNDLWCMVLRTGDRPLPQFIWLSGEDSKTICHRRTYRGQIWDNLISLFIFSGNFLAFKSTIEATSMRLCLCKNILPKPLTCTWCRPPLKI